MYSENRSSWSLSKGAWSRTYRRGDYRPSLEDNPIIYTNQGFMDMTGYSSEEILGKNCRFLQSKETDRQQVAKIRKSLNQKEKITVRLKNVKKTAPHFGMNSTLILCMLKTSSILSVFKKTSQSRKNTKSSLRIPSQKSRHCQRRLFRSETASPLCR